MADYVPLWIALISAVTVLFGYTYERRKEREFELAKTRQELYVKLVAQLLENEDLGTIANDDQMATELKKKDSRKYLEYLAAQHPNYYQNLKVGQEISTLLSIYGDDAVVSGAAKYYRDGIDAGTSDITELILLLRKATFPGTSVKRDEIETMVLI